MSFFIKRLKSIKYAVKGINFLFTKEPNARVHFVVTIIVIIAGFFLEISIHDWILVCIAICLVLTAEIFNTAIEKLVDLISPARNEKAAQIKDLAAGGVLICAIVSILIGLYVFLPKLLSLYYTA
jgi:diacylglycerol kinase (ATP)